MTEHHPALGHFKHRIVPILDRTGAPAQAAPDGGRQHLRFLTQAAFFILFILAPVFDLLRYDLVAGHAWFLGMEWHVGLDDYSAGRIGLAELSAHIGLRIFLPILGTGAALLIVAWRWGRLYCGWLCPHFSVVETINRLMRRATGKPSLWERKTLPPRQPDGRAIRSDRRWWLVTVPLAVGFAFVWAVVLLTYLLPPFEVYGNLLAGTPTRNQALFIAAATPAPWACSRAWPGWATARPWWWASSGNGQPTAPAAGRPVTTPAPCASSPATTRPPCSPAPSAPSASPPAKPPSGTTPRGRCWLGWRGRPPRPASRRPCPNYRESRAMEEYAGALWHRFITRVARRSYPQAAVRLEDIERRAGVLFRALGGDPGLRVAAAADETHGARRRWLARLAHVDDTVAHARRDQETLSLPPELALFPDRSANRDLYLWLIAQAAATPADAGEAWIVLCQQATAATLARFPGLASRYGRLVAACLTLRIPPEKLPADEAAAERAIRHALAEPGSVSGLPAARRPPQPVPLWLYPAPATRPAAARPDSPDPKGGENGAQAQDAGKRRHKTRREEMPEGKNPFILHFMPFATP